MCKIKTLKDWVKEFRLAIRQGEWLEFDTSDYLDNHLYKIFRRVYWLENQPGPEESRFRKIVTERLEKISSFSVTTSDMQRSRRISPALLVATAEVWFY